MSTDTVRPLRQRMIEDMNARRLFADTQRSHIRSCKRFAAFQWPPRAAKASELARRCHRRRAALSSNARSHSSGLIS